MSKTMSFAAVHFTVALSLNGSTLALVEPAVNSVAFYFHKQIWKRMHRRDSVAGSGDMQTI